MKLLAALAATLFATGIAAPAKDGVVTYPSSTTITAGGPLPAGGGNSLKLNTAVGEREAGLVVVTGAHRIAVTVDRRGLGPIALRLAFAHFVAFGARLVPDALLPWNGSERATEEPNQPVYVQVEVPYGTSAGSYHASLQVVSDGQPTTVPISVRVFAVVLRRPGMVRHGLLTSFHVSAQSYVNAVHRLYGTSGGQELLAANDGLYRLLAGYRISPASWGFGEPRTAAGYLPSSKWWLNSLGNMSREIADGPFATLRIPISNNRTTPHNYIAGLSPFQPEGWCPYLLAVNASWRSHGWLSARPVPYLYAYDEPDLAGQRVVARQASAAHRCFPGSRVLMTGNPSPSGRNSFLWEGRRGNDVDVWAVLSRRYYGSFGANHVDRSRRNLRAIQKLRARGKSVWSYTYAGPGTPGFLATEPLSDPRMFMLWTALEGISGVLYGEGTTSYKSTGDPLEQVGSAGEFVLVYPGVSGPIPSARLEQIRDGIEDWEIFDAVRRAHGVAAVREILGSTGLFSAASSGVRLACTVGCALTGPEPFSWPTWSHDASTPARIEQGKLEALRLAAGP